MIKQEAHEIIDPYTGKVVAHVVWADAEDVGRAVHAAHTAAGSWGDTPAYRRAEILNRAALVLGKNRDAMGHIIAQQTGKAIRQALIETDRAVQTLQLSAQEATRIDGEVPATDTVPGGENVLAYWVRRPVGVVVAITPFNAPINLACHKIGPALAVGNTVVWKTPPQVPGIGPLVADAFRDAGLPIGVLEVIDGGAETGETLVRHPKVGAVSFTGGIVGGKAVRAAAGVRPVLLELGGIALNIIHGDADVSKAAISCATGAFKNAGQSCNSVQRVMIHESAWDEAVERLVAVAQAQVVGDPLDPHTDLGPMVSEAAARRVEGWLLDAATRGAHILTGGKREGAVVTPAIVSDLPDDSPLTCEEVFGPVCTVERYRDLDAIYELAAESPVGLTHAIFTSSVTVAIESARRLRSGAVYVNRNSNARLDQLPFGGVGDSGVGGREGPRYAIEALSEMRLIVIEPA